MVDPGLVVAERWPAGYRCALAVTIDVGATPSEAKALLVRGIASVEIVDGVPDEYLAGSRKSLNAEEAETFEHQVSSLYDQMARISIAPRWARFYDFGAGRIPSFLSKLAGAAEPTPENGAAPS